LFKRITWFSFNISSKSSSSQSNRNNFVYSFRRVAYIRCFSWPSSLAELAFATILNHPSFHTDFIKKNRNRLRDRYNICTAFLRANSIPYVPAHAGFFVWADLSRYLRKEDGLSPVDRERALNDRLFNGGIHLATSEAFFGEDSGWFRISFAVDKDVLQIGLRRLSPLTHQI
jgi:DNA-binding transcriptional MocR family regulator